MAGVRKSGQRSGILEYREVGGAQEGEPRLPVHKGRCVLGHLQGGDPPDFTSLLCQGLGEVGKLLHLLPQLLYLHNDINNSTYLLKWL